MNHNPLTHWLRTVSGALGPPEQHWEAPCPYQKKRRNMIMPIVKNKNLLKKMISLLKVSMKSSVSVFAWELCLGLTWGSLLAVLCSEHHVACRGFNLAHWVQAKPDVL